MDTNPDHHDVIAELSTFCKSHNKETPKLPITRTDIQLDSKWIQTIAHEQFLFADYDNADKILMFTKTLPTLYQQISSIETALSTLHQLNLLCSTHYAQWSTISCTHSSLGYYPVKVVIPLLQLTQDHLSTT